MTTTPELFDVLDEKGSPTEERKTKAQIIKDKNWRNVIHIWVVNEAGQLLIQQRAHRGIWNDLWDVSVGGGVSAGESPEHAAIRELKEELGIIAKESDLKSLGRWNTSKIIPEMGQPAREFSFTFLLSADLSLSELTLQTEEVAKVSLMSFDELLSAINNDNEYKKWVPHPKEYYLDVVKLIQELRP